MQDLGGFPLIHWTIKNAYDYVVGKDNIIVTSDDAEILRYAYQMGVRTVTRPPELCQDDSTTEEAVLHVLDGLEHDPKITAIMQCTSPFRGKGSVAEGVRMVLYSGFDSVVFGSPLKRWLWQHVPGVDWMQPVNYTVDHRPMTQDMEGKWDLIECGDYVFRTKILRKSGNRLGGRIGCYKVTSPLHAIDIDDEHDLRVARAMVKEFNLAP